MKEFEDYTIVVMHHCIGDKALEIKNSKQDMSIDPQNKVLAFFFLWLSRTSVSAGKSLCLKDTGIGIFIELIIYTASIQLDSRRFTIYIIK